MKILAQNYSSGQLQLLEVPVPAKKNGMLYVKTLASVVSAGTEKSMIDIARKSLIGKALARPDWVKQVIDKIRIEGPMEAWRQSKARLDMPVPLGYSSAGKVIKTDVPPEGRRAGRGHPGEIKEKNPFHGAGIAECGFKVGDRVACTGSGYASHAEIVVVPPNLCAKIPDNVSFEDAAYAALGGIAMEAVRLARVEFGHRVVVIGLGLLGQLATQILVAAGCRVMGTDVSSEKCQMACDYGAEAAAVVGKDDTVRTALDFSAGEGVDSVIIFAAVKSNEPLEQAAAMCRERGQIVAGGLVGLDIPRKAFFAKELNVCVSRAWGPGALDPDYEERNVQWPLAYARWTAKRNVEEFLHMLSMGRVRVDKLTTHRFPFEKVLDAYEMVLKGKEQSIGVILEYDKGKSYSLSVNSYSKEQRKLILNSDKRITNQRITNDAVNQTVGIGLIGAGLFARGTLLPMMKKIKGLRLEGVATAGGLSGKQIAESFGFNYCTTDYRDVLSDSKVDVVFILTRHGSHAHFVCEALRAGKHIFVEKPLCVDHQQLKEIIKTYKKSLQKNVVPNNASPITNNQILMVGFNRRFAPTTRKAVEFLEGGPSTVIHIRCNAGHVPANSWVHDPKEGGGRIVGEVCHFIDLSQVFSGSLPAKVFAACSRSPQGTRDNVSMTLQMENGSVATITYAANGDKSFPREEIQIFSGGKVAVIHNFRKCEMVAEGKKKMYKAYGVDRGHLGELQTLFDALRKGKASPISFDSLVATTIATFAVEESIANGICVDMAEFIARVL